jgi:hypothetical protein
MMGEKLLKLGSKITPEQFPPSEMLKQVITAKKQVLKLLMPVTISIHGVKTDRPALSGAGLVRQLRPLKASNWVQV